MSRLVVILLAAGVLLAFISWIRLSIRRLNEKMETEEENFEREVMGGMRSPSASGRATSSYAGRQPRRRLEEAVLEEAAVEAEVLPTPQPPPPTPVSATATSSFSAAQWEQKLEVAGLLAASGEDLAVPGVESPCRLLRLKNFKRAVVVPEQCPPPSGSSGCFGRMSMWWSPAQGAPKLFGGSRIFSPTRCFHERKCST